MWNWYSYRNWSGEMMEWWSTDVSWWTLALLLAAGFLAAWIDAIVGGGGVISLPAVLLTGIPPTTALGTNKLAAITGVVTASVTFWRGGRVRKRLVMRLFPVAVAAAALGSYTVMHVPPMYLEPIIIAALLAVSGFVLLKKDLGRVASYRGERTKIWLLTVLMTMAFAFYDGFIGPGTGAFFMMAFATLGFDFVHASGNSRVLNLGSNLGSLLFFLTVGEVHLLYGVVMACGMTAGGYVGARTAMSRGAGFVRIVFMLVTGSMILRLGWQYLAGGQ